MKSVRWAFQGVGITVLFCTLQKPSFATDPPENAALPSDAQADASHPMAPASMALPPITNGRARWWNGDDYYPSASLRLGQQGRVLVEFSINAKGEPTNLAVVAAEPPRVFENNSLRLAGSPRYAVGSDWISSAPAQHRFTICVLFLLDYKPGQVRPVDPYTADNTYTIIGHKALAPRR